MPDIPVPAPRRPPPGEDVLITGDIGSDWVVPTAELHRHAGRPVTVRYTTNRVRETHLVQGVALYEVLCRVALRRDDRRKMDELKFVVLAHSEDGYQVVLSWAEISPEFGSCAALLATRYNGRTLTRPTLVMPNDTRASRFVRRLCRLDLARIEVPLARHPLAAAPPNLPGA